MPYAAAKMVAEGVFDYAKAEKVQDDVRVDISELSNKKRGTNKAEEAKYLTVNEKLSSSTTKHV